MNFIDIHSNKDTSLSVFGKDILVITKAEALSGDVHDLLRYSLSIEYSHNGFKRIQPCNFQRFYSNRTSGAYTDIEFEIPIQDCQHTRIRINAPEKEVSFRLSYFVVKRERIKIRQTIDLPYIDDLYEKFYNLKSKVVDIELPDTIKEASISSLPQLIQFIGTWSRRTIFGNLYFNIKDDNEEEYNEIIQQYISFCAINFAWRRDIKNQHEASIKDRLTNHTSKIFKKMLFLEPDKNGSILLTNIDHESSQRGLLNHFYFNKQYISHPDELEFTITKLLSGVRKINTNMFNNNTSRILEDLKVIVYELMKNTDDWAKDDNFGRLLLPNIRGLYLKFHKNYRKNFISYSENNIGLQKYLTHRTIKENKLNQIYFLELTVFDSGPGFVKRFMGKNYKQPDINTQIEIVKECLVKNSTSSIDVYKNKGQGLDRILDTLNKKGFFHVKTGNVSVYRDLVSDEYVKGATKTNIALYDWKTGLSDQFTMTYPAEGAVVSVIYPIDPSDMEGGTFE